MKKYILPIILSAVLCFPVTGFIYGMITCLDCGTNILGRIFIGIIQAFNTTFTLGQPWENEGMTNSKDLRLYVAVVFFLLLIIFILLKNRKTKP